MSNRAPSVATEAEYWWSEARGSKLPTTNGSRFQASGFSVFYLCSPPTERGTCGGSHRIDVELSRAGDPEGIEQVRTLGVWELEPCVDCGATQIGRNPFYGSGFDGEEGLPPFPAQSINECRTLRARGIPIDGKRVGLLSHCADKKISQGDYVLYATHRPKKDLTSQAGFKFTVGSTRFSGQSDGAYGRTRLTIDKVNFGEKPHGPFDRTSLVTELEGGKSLSIRRARNQRQDDQPLDFGDLSSLFELPVSNEGARASVKSLSSCDAAELAVMSNADTCAPKLTCPLSANTQDSDGNDSQTDRPGSKSELHHPMSSAAVCSELQSTAGLTVGLTTSVKPVVENDQSNEDGGQALD